MQGRQSSVPYDGREQSPETDLCPYPNPHTSVMESHHCSSAGKKCQLDSHVERHESYVKLMQDVS